MTGKNSAQDTLSLAIQHHQEGRLSSAESLYKQVLKTKPDDPETLHLFGVLMYQMDKLDLAAVLMEKAVKIDPKRADTLYNLANVLGDLGKLDQAIAAFQKAIKLNPKYAKAHYNLGILFKEHNRLDAAAESFRRAIECDPDYDKAHNNLGLTLKEQGQLSAAADSFRRAIACDPNCFQAYNNLGIVQKSMGQLSEAVASYTKAINLSPNYADAYANLGIALKDAGKVAQATAAFQRAITLDPKHTQAYFNLAGAFEEQGMTKEAIATYQRTIELDPSNFSAKHLLAALKGETPPSAPEEYVKSLFDSYDGFDRHLLERLEYKTPKLLRQALDGVLPKSKRFNNVIDLGCGTGLSGAEFKNLADRMTGVDLSPKMIKEAKNKNIYNSLMVGEIVASLNKTREQYDLFIAADVFVYMGDLDAVFQAVQKHSAEEAYFIFSVENCPKDYVLRPSGRYAHSQTHIQSLAAKQRMSVEFSQSCGLRKEKGQWVMGDLYVLKLSK